MKSPSFPPQLLRQETEALWSEFSTQCPPQGTTRPGAEQERAELRERWRAQLVELQRRGGALGGALRQIDSTQNHMVDFIDRLDRYLRQPKDVSAFTLASSTVGDIKVGRPRPRHEETRPHGRDASIHTNLNIDVTKRYSRVTSVHTNVIYK